MNSSTFIYVLKKVLVFLSISVIIMLFNSCNVHAQTYSIDNINTSSYFVPSNTTKNNMLWGTLYYNGNANDNITNWTTRIDLISTPDTPVLFGGRYLISFYLYGVGTFRDLNCSMFSSNFKNVNMTTGNWVQNEIKSKCYDIYRTTYSGYNAYRFLYEFTYTPTYGSSDGITEMEFYFNSQGWYPIIGGSTGLNYGLDFSNIDDYDTTIINTWNTDKQQQTIINQGQTQISQNETIINQQNTNTQSIINNNNSNTNSIINNQNQNTQDIIDSQSSNTQAQIDSQKVCTKIDKNNIKINGKYLYSNGSLIDYSIFGVTDYINTEQATFKTLKILNNDGAYYCFYNVNKTLISCRQSSSLTLNTDINIPTNASYVRFSIDNNTNAPQIQYCVNGNQAITDTINSDDVSGAESQLNDLLNNSAFQDNSGIQSIITAPLNFIQGLTNTCTPITLTIPFIDTNVSIPCMKQELTNRVPTLVPILSTIINGFIIYRILIDIVGIVKSAREPDEDRIEVLEL